VSETLQELLLSPGLGSGEAAMRANMAQGVIESHPQTDQHTTRDRSGATDTRSAVHDQVPTRGDEGHDVIDETGHGRVGERAEIRYRSPQGSGSLVAVKPVAIVWVARPDLMGFYETDHGVGTHSLHQLVGVGADGMLSTQHSAPCASYGCRGIWSMSPPTRNDISGYSLEVTAPQ
jgi:hypothetical protein